MAGITHGFVSGIADGADTTLVRPVDWNATHAGLTIVRKTADEIVNNSIVLQNDDHLLMAVAANEIWDLDILIRITATAVADFKFTFVVPTAATLKGNTYYDVGRLQVALDLAATQSVLFGVDRADDFHGLKAVYVGGANAGNIQLQWAQNTAEVSDTKVLADSCLIAHKLA